LNLHLGSFTLQLEKKEKKLCYFKTKKIDKQISGQMINGNPTISSFLPFEFENGEKKKKKKGG
jgi:hypothetical protein